MRTETFEGKIENFMGKPVNPPISFSGNVELYENVAEAQASEDWPGASEILKVVNTKKLTASKASAYQDATKELKKAYENSADFKRDNLIKTAVAAGFSQADAEALAASKLS